MIFRQVYIHRDPNHLYYVRYGLTGQGTTFKSKSVRAQESLQVDGFLMPFKLVLTL